VRTSKFLIATLKETPADAQVISHQLMLRSGMIRKVAAGLYNWLPLGLRVLRKVENIVRDEMDKAGAQEVLMPAVQPAELWQSSGRWDLYGGEEEVITDLVSNEIRSYRQLPANFYQIQTKFRDERRPRFGVMRAREFIMKDAYSFHMTQDSLQETYDVMFDTYNNIFTRLGLGFAPVEADTGSIGGSSSHEFHVLADSGEDAIAVCEKYNYVLVKGAEDTEHDVIALVLRGDHELNELKAEKHPLVASPLTLIESDKEIQAAAGCSAGSIGVVNLNLPIIADRSAVNINDFACGANQDDVHYINVNWGRDCQEPEVFDLRTVVVGDVCARAENDDSKEARIDIKRGIEVGHIFQLGIKYSQAMNATCLDENGKAAVMPMGCYGIGVSRIVASAIEQNHDDRGIIWPETIAPFDVVIVPIGYQKSELVKAQCDELYIQLTELGVDVLLDDRKERPGVMFADSDLMGIPHRLVIGERGLEKGVIEYKNRRSADSEDLAIDDLLSTLTTLLNK